jgi:hypothetical protein
MRFMIFNRMVFGRRGAMQAYLARLTAGQQCGNSLVTV